MTAGPLVRNIPNTINRFFSPLLSITGGDCRGQYATDLQATRTLATEVAAGTGTVIAGGANNMANGFYGNVVGGNGNWVDQSTWAQNQAFYDVLQSVYGVTITYDPTLPPTFSFLTALDGTTTYTGTNPSIVGDDPFYNTSPIAQFVASTVPGGSILGGEGNTIYPAWMSYSSNDVTFTGPTNQNVILGGTNNTITGCYSSINNGLLNTIDDSGPFIISKPFSGPLGYNTIVNGLLNTLTGCSNTLVSGAGNTLTQSTLTSVFGSGHTATGTSFSVIAGGVSNVLDSTTWSAIGGGLGNQILTANYSTICGGRANVITNNECVLAGVGLTTAFDGQTAVGRYNSPTGLVYDWSPGNPTGPYTPVFMVGGGTDEFARANFFSVTDDGWAHANGFSVSGADYAEYFESDADVVDAVVPGTSVVINPDTGNVRPGVPGATLLLGVVRPKRAAMSVVGNTANDYWHDKYLVDEMGQPVYTGMYVPPPAPFTGMFSPPPPASTGTYRTVRMLNPAYDPATPYVPRIARREWNPIGLLGRVLLLPGQPVSPKWVRLRAFNSTYDEWFITT